MASTPKDLPQVGTWDYYNPQESEQSFDTYKSLPPNYKSRITLILDGIHISNTLIHLFELFYNVKVVTITNDFVPDEMKFTLFNKERTDYFNNNPDARWYHYPICFIINLLLKYLYRNKTNEKGDIQYSVENFHSGLSDKYPDTKVVLFTKNDIKCMGCRFLFGGTEENGNVTVLSDYLLETDEQRLKLLIHEYSHSIGLTHCKKYKCICGGFISLQELDSLPLLPCIDCVEKIAFSCNRTVDEQIRISNLLEQQHLNALRIHGG